MKQIYLLIGIMLALVVCITPVAALTGDDFEIVTEKIGCSTDMYKYSYLSDPNEEYTKIATDCTVVVYTYVTFKPANIPDAPVMVVDTHQHWAHVYLPKCVDEWEVKYYLCYDCSYHLKSAGVINLNEFIEGYFMKGVWFDEFIERGLHLEIGWFGLNACIRSDVTPCYCWHIPDVD